MSQPARVQRMVCMNWESRDLGINERDERLASGAGCLPAGLGAMRGARRASSMQHA